MGDARREAYGPFLWLRFRALGVPTPYAAVDLWLRENGASTAWAVLLSSTRYALERGGIPDTKELVGFHCNAAQLQCVLGAPAGDRLVLLLVVMDGFDTDQAAEVAQLLPNDVRRVVEAFEERLADLADDPLEGSQPQDHPTSLELLGYANETLGPMKAGQIEQHLASCSGCFERFQVWSDDFEAFAAKPLPPPPPPPRDRRPLMLALLLLGVAGVVALGGVTAAVMLAQEHTDAALPFELQAAKVELLVSGKPVPTLQGLPPNALVQVRYHAANAPHMAMALRRPDAVQVLLRTKVDQAAGSTIAPIELLYKPDEERTLYLLLSEHPLSEDDVRATVGGAVSPDISVAVVPLGR